MSSVFVAIKMNNGNTCTVIDPLGVDRLILLGVRKRMNLRPAVQFRLSPCKLDQSVLTSMLCDVGQVLRCRNDKADMTNQGQYNERYTVSILSLDKQMNDATKLTQRSEQIP